MDWHGMTVIILGAGRQGTALAGYLIRHSARVVLTDQRPRDELPEATQALADLPVQWVCGQHPLSLLDGADLVCPSGGVPLTLPLIGEAQRRGIPLSNDSQIFLAAAPCRVIGITGSAGKTTTTALVGRMAQAAVDSQSGCHYRRVWVGGNIGAPLIAHLDEMQPDDLTVMELSSFQLEVMTCSPPVAAVLNVTPNHLDRHVSMEAYTAAKARLLEFQSPDDVAVLGREDAGAWSLRGRARGGLLSFGVGPLPSGQSGSFVQNESLCLRSANGETVEFLSRQEIPLRGEHNLTNVLAACTLAYAAGLPVEAVREGVMDFAGVPHRLEFVHSWGGADWYNDSIATTPERAMAAIRSFDEPLVLLAGGRDKNLPWEDFAALAAQRVRHLILFGEAAGKVERAIRSHAPKISATRCAGLRDAVRAAAEVVHPGEVVLLSPGGTSFDEFRDFEDRGEAFRRWVMELP